MKITILCVGKIKEKFYRDAIAEYSKRLSRYCKLDIIEVADEKTPENASDTVENQIREKEAERILTRLDKEAKEGAYIFALAIDGKELDSVELSKKIENLGTSGISQIIFLLNQCNAGIIASNIHRFICADSLFYNFKCYAASTL